MRPRREARVQRRGRRRQRALPGIGHRRRRGLGGVCESQRVESLLAPRGARLISRVELLEVGEADRQVDQPLAQLERGNRRLRAQQRLDRTQLPKQRGAEAEEQRRANVTDALRAAADDRRLALEPLVERGGRRLPQRGVHLGHRLPHAHHLDQLLQRGELVGRESAAAAEAAVHRAVGPPRARLGVPLARRGTTTRAAGSPRGRAPTARSPARRDALEEAPNQRPIAAAALVVLLLLGHRLGHGGRILAARAAEPTDAGEMGESGGGRRATATPAACAAAASRREQLQSAAQRDRARLQVGDRRRVALLQVQLHEAEPRARRRVRELEVGLLAARRLAERLCEG